MALAAKINQAFDNVQVCVADIADQKAKETHVKQAEILVTATNSCTPLFDGAWLSNGCHINSVGSFTLVLVWKRASNSTPYHCDIFIFET